MPENGPSPAEGMDSISRNAFFSLVTRLTTAAFTAAVTLYIVRVLGPAEYGLFALALSAGGLLLVPMDLGISGSAARFIAERRDRLPAIVDIFSDALRLRLLASGVMTVLLWFLAEPIASAYNEPDLVWPLRGVGIAVLGQVLMLSGSTTIAALGRQSLYFRVVLSESVVEATAVVSLVLLGGGAAAVAGGRAVGFVFGGILALLAAWRLLGRPRLVKRVAGAPAGYSRRLLSYGSSLFLLNAAVLAFAQIDVLLIGAYLSATAVGLFEAPLRIITFLHYFGMAAAEAIGPRLARGEGTTPNVKAFEDGLRLVFIFQLAISVVVVVWAEPITELVLGPEYSGSVETMRVLSAYAFLGGLGGLIAYAANYLGLGAQRVPIAVVTILINIGIDVWLIPEIGIIGGAIGTGVAFAFFVPAHLWICQRVLPLDLRRLGLTVLRSLAAGVALAACLFAFGTESLSWLEWIAGGIGGYGAYLAVLLLTREVDVAELRSLGGRIRQVVPGLG